MHHDVNGVHPIDIHAHYFPQTYLDVLAEQGPRFNVEYRAAEEGFYIPIGHRYIGAPNYWQPIPGGAMQIVGAGPNEFWAHQ